MSKVIHRKIVDGEWVTKTIVNPPKVKWSAIKKKKRPKPKKKKISKNKFYRSHTWAKARYEALKRSNGKCSVCGRGAVDNVVLNVDHIFPLHKYPELATDQDNLQVLCSECNWGKWGRDDGWTP